MELPNGQLRIPQMDTPGAPQLRAKRPAASQTLVPKLQACQAQPGVCLQPQALALHTGGTYKSTGCAFRPEVPPISL